MSLAERLSEHAYLIGLLTRQLEEAIQFLLLTPSTAKIVKMNLPGGGVANGRVRAKLTTVT